MPDLFHFDWYVDQHGYEVIPIERDLLFAEPVTSISEGRHGEFIRGKGGPLRAYRPLEEFSGLHRTFAELQADTPSILEFVHMYGLLGVGFSEPGLGEEDLGLWHRSIASMRNLVQVIDADQRGYACELFNKHVHPRVTARIEHEPGRHTRPQMIPFNLEGALYIQVLDELTRAIKFRRCKVCPNWFSYGPGTGRRETKEFCSARCRVVWNREKKRKIRDTA